MTHHVTSYLLPGNTQAMTRTLCRAPLRATDPTKLKVTCPNCIRMLKARRARHAK